MNPIDNSNDLDDILSDLPFSRSDIHQNELLLDLINITVRLRNKLKENENYTLTIEDTQIALDVLTAHLNGIKYSGNLTKFQKRLSDQFIDTAILFKLK